MNKETELGETGFAVIGGRLLFAYEIKEDSNGDLTLFSFIGKEFDAKINDDFIVLTVSSILGVKIKYISYLNISDDEIKKIEQCL